MLCTAGFIAPEDGSSDLFVHQVGSVPLPLLGRRTVPPRRHVLRMTTCGRARCASTLNAIQWRAVLRPRMLLVRTVLRAMTRRAAVLPC